MGTSSVVLLVVGLVLSPVIGGGLGELTNGIVQALAFCAIGARLLSPDKERREWARTPGLWFLAAFLALTLVSSVQSRAVYFSISQLLFLLACLGAYLLSTAATRDRRAAAGVVWALMLSALAVSAYGIRDYILDAGGGAGFWKALTTGGDQARLFGTFVNPTFFAGFLAMALPVTLGVYLVTRRSVLVALAGMAFVVQVAALLLTGAKLGVLAAAAALIVFLGLAALYGTFSRARMLRLLVIIIVLTPVAMPFSSPFRARVGEAKAGGTQVHSTAFRVYTWKATLNMIGHQPWLGVGPGVYPITYPQYTIAGPTKFAHNSYLQIAAENGVPALAALLLLLLAIAWKSLAHLRRLAPEPDQPQSESLAWSDLVPDGGWRLMCCAMFAALLASAVRSLADSDWYVIGIAMPFWAIAGTLVAQSGAAENKIRVGRMARPVLAALLVLAVALSVTNGLGDYYALQAQDAARNKQVERGVEMYSRAVEVSPLDPECRRQLGMWLALGQGEFAGGGRQIDCAIRLAKNTAEGGYKALGIVAGAQEDWPTAIGNLKTALKYNPNSTEILDYLARAYEKTGDIRSYEATLRRLIEIENSPYEQVKGTPEIVDTTYAFAHAYFARKYLARKHYDRAEKEYRAAIDRLERWKASGAMRTVQKYMGAVDPAKEKAILGLLDQCYRGVDKARRERCLRNLQAVAEAFRKYEEKHGSGGR